MKVRIFLKETLNTSGNITGNAELLGNMLRHIQFTNVLVVPDSN